MLKQNKWSVLFTMILFGFVMGMMTQGANTIKVYAETDTESCTVLTTEQFWMKAYSELMHAEEHAPLRQAIAEEREEDLMLMNNATDHIVTYHDRKFAITDDEYQVLLKIVEAEAPCEDVEGRILVANVVLNRMENGFGNTISDVVFARHQFEPISNGTFFRVTPSALTIEAVERAIRGEDISQGALYFMSRVKASNYGVYWFDTHLEYLFTHGGHEFYIEKE